jgi:hypothetical protein
MDYGTAHPERQLKAVAAATQLRFLRARMNSSLSFEFMGPRNEAHAIINIRNEQQNKTFSLTTE